MQPIACPWPPANREQGSNLAECDSETSFQRKRPDQARFAVVPGLTQATLVRRGRQTVAVTFPSARGLPMFKQRLGRADHLGQHVAGPGGLDVLARGGLAEGRDVALDSFAPGQGAKMAYGILSAGSPV